MRILGRFHGEPRNSPRHCDLFIPGHDFPFDERNQVVAFFPHPKMVKTNFFFLFAFFLSIHLSSRVDPCRLFTPKTRTQLFNYARPTEIIDASDVAQSKEKWHLKCDPRRDNARKKKGKTNRSRKKERNLNDFRAFRWFCSGIDLTHYKCWT